MLPGKSPDSPDDSGNIHTTLSPQTTHPPYLRPRQVILSSLQHLVMASTKELEDTLPLHDPHPDPFGHTLGRRWPIYSLIAYDDKNLAKLESDINNAEDSTHNSVLITTPDFSSSTLRDVYGYHIALRDKDNGIHPSLFIVIDQKDYQSKGVLLVDLQVMTDTSRNVIGVLRCSYSDADLYCANLDIGNMSFIDYKEEEQELRGGEDPYENTRYFGKDPKQVKDTGKQHYAWYSNIKKPGPMQELAEPGWLDMAHGESRLHSAEGWFDAADPWQNIRREFPFRCLQQPELHRKLFLVLEKDARKSDTIAICRAEWDGDLSSYEYDVSSYDRQNKDRDRVLAIMPEIKVVKRVSAEEALAELDGLASNVNPLPL
ncbi:hypothetical protein E4T43_05981 [Aureobasidium subglaciale]|nr:hypothetical protein E4T43_05981 [Aureobasidium subglaciale]